MEYQCEISPKLCLEHMHYFLRGQDGDRFVKRQKTQHIVTNLSNNKPNKFHRKI